MRPVRPVCAMAKSPQASGLLQKGCGQSIHTYLSMEVENAVSGVVPEYPISASLGSDLVTEKTMAYG